MSAAVLVLLVGLWVAVLMPGLLKARRETSPATTISRFNRNMDLLERTGRDTVERRADSPQTPPSRPRPGRTRQDPGSRRGSRGTPPPGRSPRGRSGRRGGPTRGASVPAAIFGRIAQRLRRSGEGRTRSSRTSGSSSGTAPAPRSTSLAARRRRVLAVLALIVATGVATMFFLPIVGQVVAGFGGVALAGYVAALWQIQRRRDLRRRVRHLDRARPPAQGRAESSGRRVAVGGS